MTLHHFTGAENLDGIAESGSFEAPDAMSSRLMSALPRKADIADVEGHVR
jgi:hypothetical protein